MLEVGFESVAGVYVYIDGRYLRPHSWRAGALGRDETFSIPAEDAAQLMVEDADFARAAQGYLYVEGHFVLDDPRYVTRGEDGALMLSDAARYHMDQCCLRFKMVLGGAPGALRGILSVEPERGAAACTWRICLHQDRKH